MEYLYVGEDADDAGSSLVKFLGKRAVVPKLMSPLFSKGYHLHVDNWYTSENPARYLLENGTIMCGTAMPRRLQYPKSCGKQN